MVLASLVTSRLPMRDGGSWDAEHTVTTHGEPSSSCSNTTRREPLGRRARCGSVSQVNVSRTDLTWHDLPVPVKLRFAEVHAWTCTLDVSTRGDLPVCCVALYVSEMLVLSQMNGEKHCRQLLISSARPGRVTAHRGSVCHRLLNCIE